MNDRIEKRIELKAPVSRVWRALTDYCEFGDWFRVKLDGPFVPGESRVDTSPIRVTNTSNGRPSCRRWSRNSCFRSLGIPMP